MFDKSFWPWCRSYNKQPNRPTGSPIAVECIQGKGAFPCPFLSLRFSPIIKRWHNVGIPNAGFLSASWDRWSSTSASSKVQRWKLLPKENEFRWDPKMLSLKKDVDMSCFPGRWGLFLSYFYVSWATLSIKIKQKDDGPLKSSRPRDKELKR